jgi:hypothetical protein
MAVSVTITSGYRDPGFFDDYNQQSVYPYIQATPPVVIPAHNQLDGLQGGTTTEYYHLTQSEYMEIQALVTQMTYDSGVDEVQDLILYGSITLGTGPAVDTIETTLTDDDTHIPTSGAVFDAIGGSGYWDEDTAGVLSPSTPGDHVLIDNDGQLLMISSGGSDQSVIYPDDSDILYINAGSGSTILNTASVTNFVRAVDNTQGATYYSELTGSLIQIVVNSVPIAKMSGSGVETDTITALGTTVTIEGIGLINDHFVLNEVATPGTPAANTGYLYMDSGDEHIYFKNSSTTYDLTDSGGDVSIYGTPSGNQVAFWHNASSIQGNAYFTVNTSFGYFIIGSGGRIVFDDTTVYILRSGNELYFTSGTHTLVSLDNLYNKASILGTPSSNQIAVWGSSNSVTGTQYFTISGTTMTTRYIVPESTTNWNLGSSSLFWTRLYTNYVHFVDSNTYIWRDGSNNLLFNDAVTGQKTLAQLAATGGGGIVWSGSTANGIGTYVDAATIAAEANLTFDGTTLTITGDLVVTAPWEVTDSAITEVRPLFWDSTGRVSYGPDGGGSTTDYLRADGTWAAPGGAGSPGGSNTQVQFNDSGSFGGSANFTWDDYILNVSNSAATAAWSDYPSAIPARHSLLVDRASVSGANEYNAIVMQTSGAATYNSYAVLGVKAITTIDNTAEFNLMLTGVASTAWETVFTVRYDSIYYWKVDSTSADITHVLNQNGTNIAVWGWDDSGAGFQIQTGTSFSTTPALYVGATNNHVAIGSQTDNATYELYVTGDIYATGDMYATDFNLTSDPRLKDIYNTVNNGLEIALALNPVAFRWKDHRDDYIHIGFSSKEVETVRPELVKYDDEGFGRVSYAMITAINNAAIHDLDFKLKTVEDELRDEIRVLKHRVKELEDGRSS